MLLVALLACSACGRMPKQALTKDLQEAQIQYDSGFRMLEQDSLMSAFPLFIKVAERLEVLPDDMDSAAMQLTAKAYSQMAYVFRLKMAFWFSAWTWPGTASPWGIISLLDSSASQTDGTI